MNCALVIPGESLAASISIASFNEEYYKESYETCVNGGWDQNQGACNSIDPPPCQYNDVETLRQNAEPNQRLVLSNIKGDDQIPQSDESNTETEIRP